MMGMVMCKRVFLVIRAHWDDLGYSLIACPAHGVDFVRMLFPHVPCLLSISFHDLPLLFFSLLWAFLVTMNGG